MYFWLRFVAFIYLEGGLEKHQHEFKSINQSINQYNSLAKKKLCEGRPFFLLLLLPCHLQGSGSLRQTGNLVESILLEKDSLVQSKNWELNIQGQFYPPPPKKKIGTRFIWWKKCVYFHFGFGGNGTVFWVGKNIAPNFLGVCKVFSVFWVFQSFDCSQIEVFFK